MKNIISVLLLDLLFIFTLLYELQMLQQNSYNENGKFYRFLINDIKKNYKIYLLKYLLGFVLLLSKDINIWLFIFYLLTMIILVVSAYANYQKHNDKLPLKFTKRVMRIISLDLIFYVLLQIISARYTLSQFTGLSLIYISINAFVLIIVVYLLQPIEKMVFNRYKKMALAKLDKMKNVKIIGITGSFGKTSTKMILDSLLRTTYKGFYTPASFNTPNGLLLTINNEPTIFNDYFISEMGAKNIGEIKELCDLVHPKYGILTSIGAAHLESFKSLENVCKTKFELIESLPSDGVAILNKDDEYQRKYQLKNKCKVIWIGIENEADVMAQNMKITNKGTTFDIVFKSQKKKLTVTTILLGQKNIYNILSSVALANHLGVKDQAIIQGVKNIAPINHRLEIKKHNNITIIDDSFNSNPEGAKNAIEVLALMDGEKVIITPGMVEMGDKQAELNEMFGKQIADVCDKVYLVGKKQTEPIYNGLIKNKYSHDKIFVCRSFKEAYNEVVKTSGNQKMTILIENDLPDSYMEE
ncbi:MAG: UDP-N-acetylmuramoyl-tripeptide--D-alanyl-D-alanine ligase [Firmicutes bacterium]|nr:UDP-N-acetylmuramoyl-tripeptide--D-alanyl-D-alanine ligase [Bacillota bacterium]